MGSKSEKLGLAVAGLLVLAAAAAFYMSASGGKGSRNADREIQSQPVAPTKGSGTAANVQTKDQQETMKGTNGPKQLGIGDAIDDIRAAAKLAEKDALEEIKEILIKEGADSALRYIMNAAEGSEGTCYERIKRALLVRLTSYVATVHASAGQQAVNFLKDLCKRDQVDEWVRFQALASLTGLRTTAVAIAGDPATGEVAFGFMIQSSKQHAMDPFETGLRSVFDTHTDRNTVVRQLADKHFPPSVRSAAIHAMEELGSSEFVQDLKLLSRDGPFQVRAAAVRALGKSGDPALDQHLADILRSDEDSSVLRESFNLIASGMLARSARVEDSFASGISNDKFKYALPEAVSAMVHYYAKAGALGVREPLLQAISHPGATASTIEAFYEAASGLGLVEFLPVMHARLSGVHDPSQRARLEKYIDQLTHHERYSAIQSQVDAWAARVQEIWGQMGQVPENRRGELHAEIADLMQKIRQVREGNH